MVLMKTLDGVLKGCGAGCAQGFFKYVSSNALVAFVATEAQLCYDELFKDGLCVARPDVKKVPATCLDVLEHVLAL